MVGDSGVRVVNAVLRVLVVTPIQVLPDGISFMLRATPGLGHGMRPA